MVLSNQERIQWEAYQQTPLLEPKFSPNNEKHHRFQDATYGEVQCHWHCNGCAWKAHQHNYTNIFWLIINAWEKRIYEGPNWTNNYRPIICWINPIKPKTLGTSIPQRNSTRKKASLEPHVYRDWKRWVKYQYTYLSNKYFWETFY